MKTQMYELIMFKGNPIVINEKQYRAVMEDSSSGKIGIVIGEEFVNFKNIANIREYEQPEVITDKPLLPEPIKVEQAYEDMPNYQAYKKNLKLLVDGKPPRYVVIDGKIEEKENYWHNHERQSDKVYGTWVKRRVNRQKWNTHYSQSPGYYALEYDDDFVTMGFTVIPPISDHVQTMTIEEINKLNVR